MDEKEAIRIFAQMGGRSKSPAKAAAARANGKKGGRPRKDKSGIQGDK